MSQRCYVDLCYIFGTRNLQFIFLAFFLHFSVAGEMHLCDTNLFFLLGGLRFGRPQLTEHIKVIEKSLVGVLRKSKTAEICH